MPNEDVPQNPPEWETRRIVEGSRPVPRLTAAQQRRATEAIDAFMGVMEALGVPFYAIAFARPADPSDDSYLVSTRSHLGRADHQQLLCDATRDFLEVEQTVAVPLARSAEDVMGPVLAAFVECHDEAGLTAAIQAAINLSIRGPAGA